METEELVIQTKKCSNPLCGLIKPVTEFYTNKTAKDGFRSVCKSCVAIQSKNYDNNKRLSIIEYQKKYRENHKTQLKEYIKKYQFNNSERERERIRLWTKENPEKRRVITNLYYKKNLEKIRDYRNKWKKNNPEQFKINGQNTSRKSVLLLNNHYIKSTLRNMGFTNDQLNENPELIEVKLIYLKILRLCKTLQN